MLEMSGAEPASTGPAGAGAPGAGDVRAPMRAAMNTTSATAVSAAPMPTKRGAVSARRVVPRAACCGARRVVVDDVVIDAPHSVQKRASASSVAPH